MIGKILLSDEQIWALRGLEVGEEYPPTLDDRRDVAKAQLMAVVDWGYEDCPHTGHSDSARLNKFECPECRLVLLKECEE